jgi:transcriptional regulator with PAS, ATPase and Fis domain
MSTGVAPNYPFVFSPDSPMIAVYRTLERVLDNPTTVLIEGESGTGKDALAQWIHFTGSRRDHPFIKIDFASLPDDLVESELFGFERGAFTGAVSSKLGKLDLSQTGTAVFDEVSNIELGVQAKLLNVVEAKQFYRLGGTKPIQLDCRIIALTTVPLAKAVERQMFRQDLFFRLNLITVNVPPIRERRTEILSIADTLLEQLDRKYQKAMHIHSDCKQILQNYDFPGNVRELRNGLERAMLLSLTREITPDDLPRTWQTPATAQTKMMSLEDVEKQYITEVLKQTRGKKVKAAKILGISRKTLLEKRKKYGLE